MFYRMHASIINIFMKNPKNIDYNLLENYLDSAEKSPFALGISFKNTEKISKDETSLGMLLIFIANCVFMSLFRFLLSSSLLNVEQHFAQCQIVSMI